MTTPKWKSKLDEVQTEADAKADGFLAKLQKSKWTWAMLIGVIAAAAVLLLA